LACFSEKKQLKTDRNPAYRTFVPVEYRQREKRPGSFFLCGHLRCTPHFASHTPNKLTAVCLYAKITPKTFFMKLETERSERYG
jgi:hypothetical protein